MRVRPATLDDLPDLVRLNADVQAWHRAAEPEIYGMPDPDAVAAWLKPLFDTHEILVAERDGELVGYAILTVVRREANAFSVARNWLCIDQIGATPRRTGAGRALLDAIHALAAERGHDAVDLSVRAVNTEAIAFYEALGYAPVVLRMQRKTGRPGKN